MIDRSTSLIAASNLEPLTHIVLNRYLTHEMRNDLTFDSLGSESIKDVQFVLDLINFCADPSERSVDRFGKYSIGVLLDYLRRTHEMYVTRVLPRMEMTVQSVQQAFPEHPMVSVLNHFYQNFQNELIEHIELEENRLFPYAEALYDGKFMGNYSVKEFVRQHDHNVEDEVERVMRLIAKDFPAVSASFAYRSFKHLLDEFRADLHVHHLIEEQVFLLKIKNLEDDR
ncbi:MAG: hypothetical protein RLP15_08185 [Cryomorphaceae bacterium]